MMSETTEAPEAAESGGGMNQGMGMVKGIPGERVQGVGVLDLRGVTAEEALKLKQVKGAGAILIEPGQRAILAHCEIEGVGAVVEMAADEKILMQPLVEIGAATLSAMSAGQKLTVIGILYFEPTVSAALVQEKFDRLRLIGVLLAPQAVQGALFGCLEHIGPTVTLREGGGPVIRRMGNATITPGLMANLPTDATYINIGRTEFTPEVIPEAVAAHIAHYHNIGVTVAAQPILDLLQARCESDEGRFMLPQQESDGE